MSARPVVPVVGIFVGLALLLTLFVLVVEWERTRPSAPPTLPVVPVAVAPLSPELPPPAAAMPPEPEEDPREARARQFAAELINTQERLKEMADRMAADRKQLARDKGLRDVWLPYTRTLTDARLDLTDDPEAAARRLDACPKAVRGWEWRFLRGGGDARRTAVAGVTAVAVSPGGWLAVHADGGLHLFDAAGDKAAVAPGITGPIAFSPIGRRLLAAGADGKSAVLLGAADGKVTRTLNLGGPPAGLAVSPDGQRLATAEAGGVRLWDAADGRELRAWRERGATAVACFPEGRRLAAVGPGRDGTGYVAVFDGNSGAVKRLFDVPTMPTTVAVSPDDDWLAVGGSDGIARVRPSVPFELEYDEDGQVIGVKPGPDGWPVTLDAVGGPVRRLAFDATGTRLFVATADGVRVWEWRRGVCLLRLQGGDARDMDFVAGRLAVADAAGVRLYQVGTAK